jgi:hypothetical protein
MSQNRPTISGAPDASVQSKLRLACLISSCAIPSACADVEADEAAIAARLADWTAAFNHRDPPGPAISSRPTSSTRRDRLSNACAAVCPRIAAALADRNAETRHCAGHSRDHRQRRLGRGSACLGGHCRTRSDNEADRLRDIEIVSLCRQAMQRRLSSPPASASCEALVQKRRGGPSPARGVHP